MRQVHSQVDRSDIEKNRPQHFVLEQALVEAIDESINLLTGVQIRFIGLYSCDSTI